MKMKPHFWDYCDLCEHDVVICGKCGNNTCNGGSGRVNGEECDACASAYELYIAQTKNIDRKETTTDIVKRLRDVEFWQHDCSLRMAAADAIENLREAVKEAHNYASYLEGIIEEIEKVKGENPENPRIVGNENQLP